MKIVVAAVAASALLAGCTASGIAEKVVEAVERVVATIEDVQTAARDLCQFVPSAETAADLIGLGDWPPIDAAGTIARAICDAIRAPATTLRAAAAFVPTVRGVPIYGYPAG